MVVEKQKNKYYLESIKMDAFGGFHDAKLTGFEPGFNIVYGQNESGKSTVASFIQGVCTGWQNKNISKRIENNYTTKEGNRQGSLVFAPFNGGKKIVLSRHNNRVNCIGEMDSLGIPNKEDFDSLYALNSDKLWSLGNKSDHITGQFMSAGTGTEIAPAVALDKINQEKKRYFSKDARNFEVSITETDKKIEQLKQKIVKEKIRFPQGQTNTAEKEQLSHQLEQNQQKIENIEADIKGLEIAQAKLDDIDEDIEKLKKRAGKNKNTQTKIEK